MNLQLGWSISTSFFLTCLRLGCTGKGCPVVAGASHTIVQRTPLLSLLMVHSSLRRAPLERQCCLSWLLLTSIGLGGGITSPPNTTCPLTVPQAAFSSAAPNWLVKNNPTLPTSR